MKGLLSHICLCAAAIAALGLISCKGDTVTEIPAAVPEINVATTLSFPSSAASGSFTYTVTGAVAGGVVECSSDVSWITDVDFSTAGTVSFGLDENYDADLRSGGLTLVYGYTDGGSSKYVLKRVGVIQFGASGEPFSVHPSSIAASAAAATYTIVYTVDDAAAGGTLTCSADQGWVGGFDGSVYGSVSFPLSANTGGTLRTATVTLTYEWPGGIAEKNVTVIQDHSGADTGSGVLTLDEVLGTYSASSTLTSGAATWTLRIYEYDGDDGYDVYIDGITPGTQDGYGTYGDFSTAVYGYFDGAGRITVPSQCSSTFTVKASDGSVYYLGYTPCYQYDSTTGSPMYSASWPDCTFYYNFYTGTWQSDYGMMRVGCRAPGMISTYNGYFEAEIVGIDMEKTE